MKSKTLIAVILASALLMTGCGSDADGSDGMDTLSSTPAATEPQSETTTTESTTEETSLTTEEATETTVTSEETTKETTSTVTETAPPPVVSYNSEFFSDDLFIGDSISTGLFLYGFLDKHNVFAEVGLNPESALTKQIDGVTCIQKTAAMQPRNIYIMLGTNGLAYMDGSYMANKMAELTAALETACPTADIYVITIPPVTAEHEAKGNETMELVNFYNSKLSELCAQGGYDCIDLCSLLQDEKGYLSSDYAEEDGLHFKGAAYIAMLNYVQQSAGSY